MTTSFDTCLGTTVLVRLVDPAPSDVEAVAARLGIRPTPSDGASAAVLVLRYVPALEAPGSLAAVGRDEGVFDGDSFFIRRGGTLVARIPFDAIGGAGGAGAEVVVARGTGAPARLVSLLNLALLDTDHVAVHGSAVRHGDLGILACGWSGSGKTEVLLGMTARGARYVGDEWVLVSRDGQMTGLPQAVRIEDRHVRELPALAMRIGTGRRTRMAAARVLENGAAAVGSRSSGLAGRGIRVAARAMGRTSVDLSPRRLFGDAAIAAAVPLDRLVLLEPSLDEGIRMEATDPQAVADRLAFAHVHHRRELLGWYWQYRFAFPDRVNDLLERNGEIERSRLRERFAGRPAWRLVYAHGAPIAAMADAIESAVR